MLTNSISLIYLVTEQVEVKVELLGALLHTGNLSNKTKLLVGRGWGSLREDGSLDSTKWDAFEKRMQDEGYLTKKIMNLYKKYLI